MKSRQNLLTVPAFIYSGRIPSIFMLSLIEWRGRASPSGDIKKWTKLYCKSAPDTNYDTSRSPDINDDTLFTLVSIIYVFTIDTTK